MLLLLLSHTLLHLTVNTQPSLLLLVMVVIVRRLVRRCGEVVRSIALVVHHIHATHSDGAERLNGTRKESEERNAHNTAEGDSPLLRLQTGCILRAIGASIYARTHTMAMPSSLHTHNTPPAVRSTSTTGGHKMDQNAMRQTNCILKGEEEEEKKLFSDKFSERF